MWHNGYANNSFFAYDGGISLAKQPYPSVPSNQLVLWNVGANKSSVEPQGPQDSNEFADLVRVTDAGYATGNGYGFALGGTQSVATSQDNLTFPQDVPGMVMYDSTGNKWSNTTADEGPYSKPTSGSALHFVPNFGPAGLVLAFGGYSVGNDTTYMLGKTVEIFEPANKVWKSQETIGDFPGNRKGACVVGAAGFNGTYEIFLFGGLDAEQTDPTVLPGNVYILTIPGFHWYMAPTTELGRFDHTCNMAGNRHMIVVGGVVEYKYTTPADNPDPLIGDQDPWPLGIGVFDMTDLRFTSQYNASAAPYETPKIVNAVTLQTQSNPNPIGDPLIQSWFKTMRDAPTRPTVATAPSSSARVAEKLDTGSIIGIVFGCLIGLFAILVTSYWFLVLSYRRRKAKKAVYSTMDDPAMALADGNTQYKEYSRHEVVELLPRDRP